MLSGVRANTGLDWGHFVIDLNNALCQAHGLVGDAGLGQRRHRRMTATRS